MNEQEILREAVYTFGPTSQEKMLIEEMSELTKEICKHWRGADNVADISEEMADVQIMLDQMAIVFNNAEQIERCRRFKLRRLQQRVFEEKHKE